ncbi:hypothetical protein YC2023_025190 [Brassica napus]
MDLMEKSKDIFRNTTFINEQKAIIPLPYLLLHHRFLSFSPSHNRLSLTVEQTQDEEEQQVEVGVEFGDGDKERETSKTNEQKFPHVSYVLWDTHYRNNIGNLRNSCFLINRFVIFHSEMSVLLPRNILLMAHVMKIKICFVFMLKGSM